MALAATNDQTAGANCKRHDAAPIMFGRGASAPGEVRRLAGLNAKLGRGPLLNQSKSGVGGVLSQFRIKR